MTGPLVVEVEGRRLTLSNLDKTYYPDAGFTKGHVLDYYARAAHALVPHLAARPLTLKRFPEGATAEGFYQKNAPEPRPPWLRTFDILGRQGETTRHVVADDLASLIFLANLGTIEFHPLLSRVPDINRPTQIAFDLDPGPNSGPASPARLGLELRDLLADVGLQSFPKTSGGKGLHVYVPLHTDVTFDDTKSFSRQVADTMAAHRPSHVTSNMRKDLRVGRVLVDWSQNDRHKTTVAAYSLRARSRPNASTPLQWAEVEAAAEEGPLPTFEADHVLRRLDAQGDLFAPVLQLRQSLPGAPAQFHPSPRKPPKPRPRSQRSWDAPRSRGGRRSTSRRSPASAPPSRAASAPPTAATPPSSKPARASTSTPSSTSKD
jgi:bifunctional non-homologous end joining protein LigD